MVENISSQALPGQIMLTWSAPAGEYSYMKIGYYDPLQKKDVTLITSKGTTEVLIDETRQRFGEYTFTFQSFNANHEGGEVRTFNAMSDKAPATYNLAGRKQVTLYGDQLSTNAQEPSEGPIANAVDGNLNSFFHTNWHEAIPYPQWIQIDLREPHQHFIIGYVNRYDNTWTSEGRPSQVDFRVSNDGVNWTTVGEISGLPTAARSEYTSTYFMVDEPYTYFRFSVNSATNNTTFWNIAELYFYDAEVEIYDPETVDLD